MKNKGLTISVVMLAQSANYGEGVGNIALLKRFTRNDGHQYTYMSRQALRYNIVEQLNWNNTPVDCDNKVVQFSPDATIMDYPEIDLFGYMKVKSKSDKEKGGASTRSAVVRLSDAISLEPFAGDMDFLTNMGLAKRIGAENSLAQSEQHLSYYAYTVTIDLSRVGVDGELEIPAEEKVKRVNDFLSALEFLNRDIRGRNENLNPLFVIGGVYDRKNPFFKDRIKVKDNQLQVETLKEIVSSHDFLKEETKIGVVSGIFDNDAQIKSELNSTTVASVFEELKQAVRDYYAG